MRDTLDNPGGDDADGLSVHRPEVAETALIFPLAWLSRYDTEVGERVFLSLIEPKKVTVSGGIEEDCADALKIILTPDWLKKLYPDLATITLALSDKIFRVYIGEKARMLTALAINPDSAQEISDINLIQSAVAKIMNNFHLYVTAIDKHFKFLGVDSNKGLDLMIYDKEMLALANSMGLSPPGDRIKDQTYRQFLGAISDAMAENQLTVEKAKIKPTSTEVNCYLFPAFVSLVKSGYRIYPDLS